MNANLAAVLYLVAGILFILALRGLSSPASSRQGNRFGMIGMAIAILTTLALKPPSSAISWLLVVLGFAIGGGIGVWRARTIQMTAMPQLVAMFHSLVGLAAVLVAAGALYAPEAFGIAEGDGHPPGEHHRNVARPTRSARSPSPARSSPSSSSTAACRARRSFCRSATRSTSASASPSSC